jgi:formate dehydrogenase maturation protein FdhE
MSEEIVKMDESRAVKEPMYFFTVKAKRQKALLTAALPHLKPFIEEFRRITKLQEGGPKIKAAREAQAKFTSAEAALLIPSNKDKAECQENAINARVAAMTAIQEAEEERTEQSFEILESVIDKFVSEYYDNALATLSVLTGKTTDDLEENYDIFDLGEMLFDVVEQERVQSFFSRVQRLKSRMR